MSSGLLPLGRASCGAVAGPVPPGARARALAWSTLLLAAACAPDAGRAVVTFRFSEPPTLAVDGEPVDTVLTLRVEERAEVTRFLGASAPRLLPAGSREEDIVLPGIQIPHGDRRVVTMELALTGGEILYYGESAPFSLHAGDVITVPIALEPRARPALQVEVLGAVEGRVPSSDIEVRVTAPGARRVELSNLSSFEGATAQDVSPDGILAWDLDRGLRGACVEDDACPRKLSVRVRDDHDVPSTIVEVALVVDTRGPAIQPQTLSVLLPSGEPWLSTPTALAAGATATITFAVTERLGAPPVLLGGPLARTLCVVEGLVVRCAVRAPDTPSPGTVPLGVRLVDLVGHEAVLPLTDLELAPAAPPPPDTTRVVLERAPWGRGASAEPYYVVRGEAGAATPGSRVVAFPGAVTTNVVELARTSTVVDALGRFALVLPALADSQAYVGLVLVSAAGQPSDAMLTQPGVQATLTTRGRVSMRVADPRAPVSVARVPSASPLLAHPASEDLSTAERSALTVEDGVSVEVKSKAVWTRYEPATEEPEPRYRSAMAYDRARGEWVMFGGETGSEVADDLWIHDGRRWSRRARPDGVPSWPPPRREHALVYDSERQVVLLYGGESPSATALDDMWAWNGSAWRELTVSGPGPRVGHAMAYDRTSGHVVLHGGYAANRAMAGGETWLWDGRSWVLDGAHGPGADGPGARARASMTFDPITGQLLMFGGERERQSPALGDLWSRDHHGWRLLSDGRGSPPPRVSAGLVSVPGLRGVLLFGGRTDNNDGILGPSFDDVYLWSPQTGTWSRWGNLPLGSRGELAVSEADARGGVLVFGGRTSPTGTLHADTWRFEQSDWVRWPSTQTWPPRRKRYAAAYMPDRGRWLIAGGVVAADDEVLSDAWSWDGHSWAREADIPRLKWPMLAWDEARAVLVLFGTLPTTPQTEAWELELGRWQRKAALARGSYAGAAAYLAALGGVVVHATHDVSSAPRETDTRLWAAVAGGAASWSTPQLGAGSPDRFGYAMAAAPLGDALFLFGGVDSMGLSPRQLGRFDAAGWSSVATPLPRPPAQLWSVMTPDSSRGDIVMFDGTSSDVWALDPRLVTWSRLDVAGGGPPPLSEARLGGVDEGLWLFGGGDASCTTEPPGSDGLWRLQRPTWGSGSLQVGVAWAGLGLSETASVTVTLRPGNTRISGAAVSAAVQLWRARAGVWTDVDAMMSDADAVRVGAVGAAVGGTQVYARLKVATPVTPVDAWSVDALGVELEY